MVIRDICWSKRLVHSFILQSIVPSLRIKFETLLDNGIDFGFGCYFERKVLCVRYGDNCTNYPQVDKIDINSFIVLDENGGKPISLLTQIKRIHCRNQQDLNFQWICNSRRFEVGCGTFSIKNKLYFCFVLKHMFQFKYLLLIVFLRIKP